MPRKELRLTAALLHGRRDFPEALDGGGDERAHVLGVGDIGLDASSVVAEFPSYLGPALLVETSAITTFAPSAAKRRAEARSIPDVA